MVKKRTFGEWLKALVLLLDEAAALVLIFLVLRFLGVKVPLLITIPVLLIFATFSSIIHIKVISSFRWKQVTGREGMVNLQGTVVKLLTPVGTIQVKGENWKAKSVDGEVETGENVEVVGIEGLTLSVVQLQED